MDATQLQQIARQIEDRMHVRGYSRRSLAAAAGVNPRTIDHILEGRGQAAKLRQVLDVLGLRLDESVREDSLSEWSSAAGRLASEWIEGLPESERHGAVIFLASAIRDYHKPDGTSDK